MTSDGLSIDIKKEKFHTDVLLGLNGLNKTKPFQMLNPDKMLYDFFFRVWQSLSL